jgi:uroporphyrinogen-III synthase
VNGGGLAGCGVLITRAKHQAHELKSEIEAAGGDTFLFPAINIVGRDIDEIGRELAEMPEPDIVIFVSGNAVAYGLAAVKRKNAKIAVVGPATRAAIESMGVNVDIFPQDGFDSEHLLQHEAFQAVQDKSIVIVRGQSGRELLADTLRERGANVQYLGVYNRIPHEPTLADLEDLEFALDQGRIAYVIVMSVETLDCLAQIIPARSLSLLRHTTLVAPSTRVLQRASELIPGIATELAPGPQAPAMVNTLIGLRQSGQI